MRIDTYLTADSVKGVSLAGKIAVVIDVLRAGTSICSALANNALKIIPTASVGDAGKIAANCDKKITLFCGERNGKPIDGFDLGNSPFEFEDPKIDNKTLVMATTNGTRAIVNCAQSLLTIVCSFNNFHAVVDFLKAVRKDIVILCSGKDEKYALEDAFLAGQLVYSFTRISNVELNDTSLSAKIIYKYFRKDVPSMINECEHGKYLKELGFERDLEFAIREDIYNFIPVNIDNFITKKSKAELVKLI